MSESIAAAVPADIKKGHQLLGQANRQLRIGEVALRTELSVRTVRHYHEVGLVEPSARSAGGFRLYTESDVQRLLVIRRMKPLGFTLAGMRQLLDSLEVLHAEGATEEQRADAHALLGRYRQKTRDSAERLRRQLAYADELSDLLADAVATTPGPVR